VQQRAAHAEGEQHPAAAEVPHQVERRHGSLARAPERAEHAGERDVVDVVAGSGAERSALTPAGHAAVDESRVARQHGLGPQAEALHDAGAKALDERIRARDELERGLRARGRLEIERHRAPAAHHDVVPALALEAQIGGRRTIDEQHVRAHVRKQHSGERSGPDRLEFKHANAAEGSHEAAIIYDRIDRE